mgnify:CR=1 FL=1
MKLIPKSIRFLGVNASFQNKVDKEVEGEIKNERAS